MRYGEKEPYFNHCLVVDTCDDIDNVKVDVCKDEKDLLERWADLIKNEDPDIIIGYNIFGFDYEFMFRRLWKMTYVKISLNYRVLRIKK